MDNEKNSASSNRGVSAASLWDWVKAICSIFLCVVLSLRLYYSSVSIDFVALLSTLLALFSVALSAMFYFKATDTSNKFYDNTYKYSKDVAELLVKIESGFGEKLKNLDDGYNSMRSMIQSSERGMKVEITKEKIETEKNEIDKVKAQRDAIVQNLIDKANLQEEEKDRISAVLAEKEMELQNSQNEMTKLKKRLFTDRISERKGVIDFENEKSQLSSMKRYIRVRVLPNLLNHLDSDSYHVRNIIKAFNKLLSEEGVNSAFRDDMERFGYIDDNGLSLDGARLIRNLLISERDINTNIIND